MTKLPPTEYSFKNDSSGDTGTSRILDIGEIEEALSAPYHCTVRLAQNRPVVGGAGLALRRPISRGP